MFINLKYKPKRSDLVAEYYVEPSKGLGIKKVSSEIASESSIGTWTSLVLTKKIQKLGAKVFFIKKEKKGFLIKIAYPNELFEKGNMPQILSSIAGNIFGMKNLKKLRLEDIYFPKKIVQSFKGPKFGIPGIRRLFKKGTMPLLSASIKSRPLVGTIIKPKLGLNEKEHAKRAFQAWIGGCDIVKDDENLTNMKFNKFKKRIIETLKLRDKAEKITGEKKIYMPNITSEAREMLERADFVKEHNGEYVMIDIITSGWSALQTLRDVNEHLKLVIHAHRAGHASFTRGLHGISMLVIAKISRLIGVDQLHIGALGKMEGKAKEIKHIGEEIEKKFISKKGHVLEQKFYNLKPVFAVCSGGLHPALVPKLIKLLGKNIILQAGGGIHGHPLGTAFGARAMRQALDAIMKKIPLEKYARTHLELKAALDKWS